VQAEDLRAVRLQKFLDRYPWSPLRGHEHEILYCADKFGIDYRLYLAIAGAESTYGKRYPEGKRNLTGHLNGATAFSSIWQNIYETSKLIGTAHYYRKYRETNDIRDLIYVYKGVPPYEHYYKNMRYALDQIGQVDITAELKAQSARLARLEPRGKTKLTRKQYQKYMGNWLAIRYDKFACRTENTVELKIARN
jgi:hypothetical protein